MDLNDKKILCELDEDCRQPYSKIAKKLKIGRNVVEYRIKRLEKQGIIKGYISTINLGILGYKTYRIFLKTNQTYSQERFIEYMKKSKNILHLIRTEGYFDYTLTIAVKSLKELDDYLMDLKTEFKEIIKENYISILVYSKIFRLNKLLLSQNNQIIKIRKFQGEEKTVKIDEKDKMILKELSQSANKSIVELSEKTKLSVDIIKHRLKSLKEKVIISNRIILDLNKLGYYNYVIMIKMKEMTRQGEEKIDSWCCRKKCVIYYGKGIGGFDFKINIAIGNIEELNLFFTELKKDLGNVIDTYELVLNTEMLKLNYLPL